MIFLFACDGSRNSIDSKYQGLSKIDYCDLPDYKNKEVILTCTYSGFDEYWSLGPIEPCEKDLSVDFDTFEYYSKMPEKFQQILHSPAKYFIIKAVGRYERIDGRGYGHLNHLQSRFIVKELLDVRAIKG